MKTSACSVVFVVVLLCPTLLMAQRYRDKEFNALELAQLPKYCYAQYMDDKLSSDPQYSIQGCGPFMNHYCGALIGLMRAQQSNRSKAERRRQANHAVMETNYTLNNMPQGCWLRPEAEATLSRAKFMATLLK